MTTSKTAEFKPVKKLSPFASDPHNNRGGKGGKKGTAAASGSAGFKGGKKLNVTKFKGGTGGDR